MTILILAFIIVLLSRGIYRLRRALLRHQEYVRGFQFAFDHLAHERSQPLFDILDHADSFGYRTQFDNGVQHALDLWFED